MVTRLMYKPAQLFYILHYIRAHEDSATLVHIKAQNRLQADTELAQIIFLMGKPSTVEDRT